MTAGASGAGASGAGAAGASSSAGGNFGGMGIGQGGMGGAGAQSQAGGAGQIVSGIGSIASAYIDFKLLKVQQKFAENRAAQIELQAEERSNILLEQFNSAIGNIQYSAARRGVKAGEGSVARNIEASGAAIGSDVKKSKKGASLQAGAVRAQGRIDRATGKARASYKMAKGFEDVAKGAISMGGGGA